MKLVWISLLLCLCAVPAQAQDVDVHVPYTWFTLANGLNVILHEDHSTGFVAVNMRYGVGSAREMVGRTGLAHLLEHLMLEGSRHVPEGREWLESAGSLGGDASTGQDFTSYEVVVPAHALELALFIESDRMGYLFDGTSPRKLDVQREVVKNERRQIYENQPYGLALFEFFESLFPADHPYHRPIGGYVDDLVSISFEDVESFHRKYYGPNNASLVIAGSIDIEETRRLVERWFGEIPSGPPVRPVEVLSPALNEERRIVQEDRVQLPRLYMVWQTPPAYGPGNAEVKILSDLLANGNASRLRQRLIDTSQIAQDVQAYQWDLGLSSVLWISATARPGHTLAELEGVIEDEIRRLHQEPPTAREVQRAVNKHEAAFLDQLQSVHAKADQLNAYWFHTGTPDYFGPDLLRFTSIGPDDVQAAARRYLTTSRVVLSVVPQGRLDLAARASAARPAQ
jgi:zinc protease